MADQKQNNKKNPKKGTEDDFVLPPIPISKMEHQEKLNYERKEMFEKLRQGYKEQMGNAAAKAEKGVNIANMLKVWNKEAEPLWFQELSSRQKDIVDNLIQDLCDDIKECQTYRTVNNLVELGINPYPTAKTVRSAMKNSNGKVLPFIFEIFKSFNGKDPFTKYDYYESNERLMLSAVANLTIHQTLQELLKRVPDPLPADPLPESCDHIQINPKVQEPSNRPKVHPILRKNPNAPLKMYLERQFWPKFPKSYAVPELCIAPSISPYNEPSKGLFNLRPNVPSKLKVRPKACLCDQSEEEREKEEKGKKKKKKKKKSKGRGKSAGDDDEDDEDKPPRKPNKKSESSRSAGGGKHTGEPTKKQNKKNTKSKQKNSDNLKKKKNSENPDDSKFKIDSLNDNLHEGEFQITGVTKTDKGEMFIISGIDNIRPTNKMINSIYIQKSATYKEGSTLLEQQTEILSKEPRVSCKESAVNLPQYKTSDCNCLARLEEIKEVLDKIEREGNVNEDKNHEFETQQGLGKQQQVLYFHPPKCTSCLKLNDQQYSTNTRNGYIKLSVEEALKNDLDDKMYTSDYWKELNDGLMTNEIDPSYLMPSIYRVSTEVQATKQPAKGVIAINPPFNSDELNDDEKDKREKVTLSKNEKEQTAILKSLFAEMAGDDFILCKLPDAHKIPYFKYWMKYHCGYRMGAEERRRILATADKILKRLSAYTSKVYLFKPDGVVPCHMSETYDFHNHLLKISKKKREEFYRLIKCKLIDDARLYWTFFNNIMTPMKGFSETYNAYMPSRELDIFAFRPWQISEVVECTTYCGHIVKKKTT